MKAVRLLWGAAEMIVFVLVLECLLFETGLETGQGTLVRPKSSSSCLRLVNPLLSSPLKLDPIPIPALSGLQTKLLASASPQRRHFLISEERLEGVGGCSETAGGWQCSSGSVLEERRVVCGSLRLWLGKCSAGLAASLKSSSCVTCLDVEPQSASVPSTSKASSTAAPPTQPSSSTPTTPPTPSSTPTTPTTPSSSSSETRRAPSTSEASPSSTPPKAKPKSKPRIIIPIKVEIHRGHGAADGGGHDDGDDGGPGDGPPGGGGGGGGDDDDNDDGQPPGGSPPPDDVQGSGEGEEADSGLPKASDAVSSTPPQASDPVSSTSLPEKSLAEGLHAFLSSTPTSPPIVHRLIQNFNLGDERTPTWFAYLLIGGLACGAVALCGCLCSILYSLGVSLKTAVVGGIGWAVEGLFNLLCWVVSLPLDVPGLGPLLRLLGRLFLRLLTTTQAALGFLRRWTLPQASPNAQPSPDSSTTFTTPPDFDFSSDGYEEEELDELTLVGGAGDAFSGHRRLSTSSLPDDL